MIKIPIKGCGDHSCVVSPPEGMGTNGGCRCTAFTLQRAVTFLKIALATLMENKKHDKS